MENRKKYRMMEVVKTLLWVCGFFAVGFLITNPRFEGKSKTPAKAKGAVADVYLEDEDNPRVRELIREYKPISFSSLGDYFYYTPEPGGTPDPELVKKSRIPDNVKTLNGSKVAINGFMMPIDQNQDGSREFVLNGAFDMCGFGGPISINQWIVVKYIGSGRVPFTHLPMSVFGELEVGEEYKDGFLVSIYRMKAKAVSMPNVLIE
ncbi:MAG: DUF3299 domain-containing protein [Chloracidobacterium sp.]|nr:DUF3299 domain-containing protein [Chloracidobacterium sp.]